MKNNITELVFILDQSGSMSGLEADTIGGFNGMIEKQKKQEGLVYVSTVLFDDVITVLHDRVKLSEVKPMTEDDYLVGGCTSLLDLSLIHISFGGIKMAEQACETYGYTPNPKYHKIFTEYCTTHNQGVFDAYTPEMKLARHNKIITGLPDTYGRGRIVGDYRRVALYGIDFLISRCV